MYGLSLLLALTAAAAAYADRQRRTTRSIARGGRCRRHGDGLCGVGPLRGCGGRSLLDTGDPVRVAVLQANIAQQDKWNPSLADAITDRYIDDDAAGAGAGRDVHHLARVVYAVLLRARPAAGLGDPAAGVEGKATLLIGSDQVEPVRAEPGREKPEERIYNAAFLVRPDGRTGAVYRKMQLVPFGEYVPAQRLLFFVGPIVEAVVATSCPAPRRCCCRWAIHRASTAICYEVIFAEPDAAVRRQRQRAADDDHQRRLVWHVVGAIPALGPGGDARDRGRPLSRARGEYRHQRLRRSVRARDQKTTLFTQACSSPICASSRRGRSTPGSATWWRGCRWRSPWLRFWLLRESATISGSTREETGGFRFRQAPAGPS